MADWSIDTLRIASPAGWLAGPLFDKELRVASRRWKYYLLRFAYVCLLAVVIVHFWQVVVRVGGGGSAVARAARLGELGKHVIVTIVWFQFLAAQVLAVVLLSDAISGEVRRRSLEDLFVTPIRPIHLVLGKLLSRLLHVVLLLAISLPVLAVVRVFGGVPWDYVLAGLGITLSASVFAGALSLLCSILHRHAYRAILTVMFWYLALWGLDAFLLTVLPRTGFVGNPAGAFLWSLTSPFHALFVRTQVVLMGSSPVNPCASLALHCATILLAAGVIVVLSARRVRRLPLVPTPVAEDEGSEDAATEPRDFTAALRWALLKQPIRRVRGSPIVWKDLQTPWVRTQGQALLHVGLWLIVGGLVLVTLILVRPAMYGNFFIPKLIVQWVFLIRMGVAAVGTIAHEKEARTWPILLATPLENGAIVRGKALGVWRRNGLLLIPLLIFYLLAFLLGRPGERDLPHLVLCAGVPFANILSVGLLLVGTGLYAGVMCRTTAGATAWMVGTYLSVIAVAGLLPTTVLGMPGQRGGGSLLSAVLFLVLVTLIYGGLGVFSLLASARALRRHVF